MSRTEEIFMPALAGAKLPILTLDNKWHKLFDQLGTDKRVKKLEDKLNDLLKTGETRIPIGKPAAAG